MEIDRTKLNNLAWQRVQEYQNLSIAGKKVHCPYAINFFSSNIKSLMQQADVDEDHMTETLKLYKQRHVGYGWYRGKGTPEQIAAAAEELGEMHGYNLANSTPAGIAEFMKLFGLGVDCSGFVFNVLEYAYSQTTNGLDFSSKLSWKDKDRVGVDYAGAAFLADNSRLIEASEVQPLDLVFYYSDGSHSHIALILESENGLQIVQSNIDCLPTGINVSALTITSSQPNFAYTPAIGSPWNDYRESLQFRRLAL